MTWEQGMQLSEQQDTSHPTATRSSRRHSRNSSTEEEEPKASGLELQQETISKEDVLKPAAVVVH